MASVLQRLFAARKNKQARKAQEARQQNEERGKLGSGRIVSPNERPSSGTIFPEHDGFSGSQSFSSTDPHSTALPRRPRTAGDTIDVASIVAATGNLGIATSDDLHQSSRPLGEDDEPTDSPIYQRIIQLDGIQSQATLVLLPSRATIHGPALTALLSDDIWVSRHAFEPSKLFTDRYVSIKAQRPREAEAGFCRDYSLEVTFPSQGLAEIACKRDPAEPPSHRRLKVIVETTVYMSSKASPPTSRASVDFEVLSRPNKAPTRKITVMIVAGPVVPPDPALYTHGSSFGPESPGDAATAQATEDTFSTASVARSSPAKRNWQQEHTSGACPASSGHSFRDGAARFVVSPPPEDGSRDALSDFALRRDFHADLLLLLCPPEALRSLKSRFTAALDVLANECREFLNTFVLVPQYEGHYQRRLREGILTKAWAAFEYMAAAAEDEVNLSPQDKRNLHLVLENVMMGFVHAKVWPALVDIAPAHDEDLRLHSIIASYRNARIRLTDLGASHPHLVRRPARLDSAIRRLSIWRRTRPSSKPNSDALLLPDYVTMACDTELHPGLSHLLRTCGARAPGRPEYDDLDLDLDATFAPGCATPESTQQYLSDPSQTPLDILHILRTTVDAIMSAATRLSSISLVGSPMSSSSSLHSPLLGVQGALSTSSLALATDELVLVLAFVIVKAAPARLLSRLKYARLLAVSENLSPEHEWALVTFEAVTEWLLSDPLKLQIAQPVGRADEEEASQRANSTLSCSRTSSHRRRCACDSDTGSTQAFELDSRATTGERMRRLSLPATAILAGSRDSFAPVSTLDDDHMSRQDSISSTASQSTQGKPGYSQPSSAQPSALTSSNRSPTHKGELVIRPQIVTRPTLQRAWQDEIVHEAHGTERSPVTTRKHMPLAHARHASLVSSLRSTQMTRAESDGAPLRPQGQPPPHVHLPRRSSFGSAGVLGVAASQLMTLPARRDSAHSRPEPELSGNGLAAPSTNSAEHKTNAWLPRTASSWTFFSSTPSGHSTGASGSSFSQLSEPASVVSTSGESEGASTVQFWRSDSSERGVGTLRSRSRPPSIISTTTSDVIPEDRPYHSAQSQTAGLVSLRSDNRQRATRPRQKRSTSDSGSRLLPDKIDYLPPVSVHREALEPWPGPGSETKGSAGPIRDSSLPVRQRKRTLSHLLTTPTAGSAPLPPQLSTPLEGGGAMPTAEMSPPLRTFPAVFSSLSAQRDPVGGDSIEPAGSSKSAHKRSHSEAV
ncbi:unnamed protein product [Parajaminaea phylloscopi]